MADSQLLCYDSNWQFATTNQSCDKLAKALKTLPETCVANSMTDVDTQTFDWPKPSTGANLQLAQTFNWRKPSTGD